MNLIKNKNILKASIICFMLSIIFSCSNNQNRHKKLENLLYNFHIKNSSEQLKNKIELLIVKDIDVNYKGLFYKVKNSSEFYCGFIDYDDNIIKTIRLKNRKSVNFFANSMCLTMLDNKNEAIPKQKDDCFTLFLGELPYDGYSNIELEWNCSSGNKISEKLINKKYFFFLKKDLGIQVCNIKLTNDKGQVENVSYNIGDGTFLD